MATEWYTPREAWTLLRVSRSQFYKMMRAGEIPAVVAITPRCLRINAAALNRWLENKTKDKERW